MTNMPRWFQRVMGNIQNNFRSRSHSHPHGSNTTSNSNTDTNFPAKLPPNGVTQKNYDYTRKRLTLLKNESARKLDGYLCNQPPYLPKLSEQVLEKLEKLWSDYKKTKIVVKPNENCSSQEHISSNSNLTENLTSSESSQFYFIKYLFEVIYDKSFVAIQIVRSIDHQTDIINQKDNPRLKQLNEISLVFTYINYEITAFSKDVEFRENTLTNDSQPSINLQPSPKHNYRLTKIGAQKFWEDSFEKDCLITGWDNFYRKFISTFHDFNPNLHETMQFQQAVDITKSGFVSIYIFDVFVRLFAPWKNIHKVWLTLGYDNPAFKANMTYDEAAQRIGSLDIGSFLYRMSNFFEFNLSFLNLSAFIKIGQWAIAYRTEYNVLQSIPEKQNLAEALIEGVSDGRYRYPDGRLHEKSDIGILAELAKEEYEEIEVPEEDWYKPIGSSFEQCKLCYDHQKNVKLEPCGHLSCVECLRKWRLQEQNKTTCPFCREEVRSSATIKFTYQQNLNERKIKIKKAAAPPKTIPEEDQQSSGLTPPPKPQIPGRFSPIAPTTRAPDPPEFNK